MKKKSRVTDHGLRSLNYTLSEFFPEEGNGERKHFEAIIAETFPESIKLMNNHIQELQ